MMIETDKTPRYVVVELFEDVASIETAHLVAERIRSDLSAVKEAYPAYMAGLGHLARYTGPRWTKQKEVRPKE